MSVFGVIWVRIQSEFGKIQTRKTLNTDNFYLAHFTICDLPLILRLFQTLTLLIKENV